MRHDPLRAISQGLILIAVILGLIAAALWFRSGPLESGAQARTPTTSSESSGVPDAGLQRREIIEQLVKLNDRLADIERGWREGAFIVQTMEPKGTGRTEESKEPSQ